MHSIMPLSSTQSSQSLCPHAGNEIHPALRNRGLVTRLNWKMVAKTVVFARLYPRVYRVTFRRQHNLSKVRELNIVSFPNPILLQRKGSGGYRTLFWTSATLWISWLPVMRSCSALHCLATHQIRGAFASAKVTWLLFKSTVVTWHMEPFWLTHAPEIRTAESASPRKYMISTRPFCSQEGGVWEQD